MNPELSTYLNMLRVFAARAVFVGHICIWKTNCGAVGRLPWLGGDGVVIFFVLSGYVVTYTADTKDKTARTFFINRCARIYSVVIPAIMLTLFLEIIGVMYLPEKYGAVYQNYQFARLWAYIPIWPTFSSELWRLNEQILINGAFLSLCFEVWFYLALALSLFVRGTVRIVALLMVILIAGPKICVLFSLWGLGVLVYYAQKRISLRPAPARLLLLLSFAA
jgi:peptidoglycan/LPS O-acetylase OafA/YrhL